MSPRQPYRAKGLHGKKNSSPPNQWGEEETFFLNKSTRPSLKMEKTILPMSCKLYRLYPDGRTHDDAKPLLLRTGWETDLKLLRVYIRNSQKSMAKQHWSAQLDMED
jgi:hypothetical protein